MAKAKHGDPKVDVEAWNAAVGIHQATSSKVLRNLDLITIEYIREQCALFLARSEKYIRIRQDQSTKSQLNKMKGK